MAEARSWFEDSFLKQANAKTAADEAFSVREPKWKYAFNYKVSAKQQVVVVPLAHFKRGRESGVKEMWVYKNEKGQNTLRVVEYLYATTQQQGKGFDKRNYSGLFLVKDWNDNFIGGYVVEKNKLKSVVSEFGYGKPKPKSGRTSVFECSAVHSCTVEYVPPSSSLGVGGAYTDGTSNQGYYYHSCQTSYNCVWHFSFESDNPALEGDGSYSPPYDGSVEPDPKDPNYRWEKIDNTCQGLTRMIVLQDSLGNLPNSSLHKEVNGVITTTGKVIIFPTIGNSEFGAHWDEEYKTPNGDLILTYKDSDRNITPIISKVRIYKKDGTYEEYQVSTMVHTHPDGHQNSNIPSIANSNGEGDLLVAHWYRHLNHILLGSSKLVRFNFQGVLAESPLPWYPYCPNF